MSYPPEPPPPDHGSGQPSGPPYVPPYLTRTNGKATASLVTGIVSVVLSWCPGLGVVGVVAIVLGVKARNEIQASGGTQQGDGLALGGIVTGSIAVAFGLLIVVLIVIAFATGHAHFETSTTSYTART